uniref:Uncharacterized protein n=1 Tax=Onchocerca volvulus TaxID=6282 RepID=A0A8R1Y4L5_ONCVO
MNGMYKCFIFDWVQIEFFTKPTLYFTKLHWSPYNTFLFGSEKLLNKIAALKCSDSWLSERFGVNLSSTLFRLSFVINHVYQ